MKNKELKYPSLVVPYQKIPLRDRAYPYVVSGTIAILIVIIMIQLHIKVVS